MVARVQIWSMCSKTTVGAGTPRLSKYHSCSQATFRCLADRNGVKRNDLHRQAQGRQAQAAVNERQAPTATHVRVELWQALIGASIQQIMEAMSSVSATVGGNVAKIQRYVLPRPVGFPPGPDGEQSLAMLSGPLEYLARLRSIYGPVSGVLLGGERVVVASSPAASRVVLVDKAEVFIKEGTAFFPGSSLTGNGLLVSDGELWKRQRRLSNPAFRRSMITAYADQMTSCTEALLSGSWGQGGIRDVYADFNDLTLQITLRALFSTSLDESTSTQVVNAVERAFDFFSRRGTSSLVIPEWVPTLDNLEFGLAVEQLNQVVYDIIAMRRAQQLSGSSSPPRDLLQSLMTSEDDQGGCMTDRDLRDELMTLLVAGQETSAILLGWATALLAWHTDVQDKAAQEVHHVLGSQPPTASCIPSLRYVEATVLEALRLYAPAYLIGRCANQDVELCGYQLPAGTTVLLSPYLMHRDPELWSDAESFRPERWLEFQTDMGVQGYPALLKDLGPGGAYIPFGGGPRNCIGTGFAMMEGVLVLAACLQKYRFEVPEEGGAGRQFPNPKPMITLRPDEVVVKLSKR